MQNSCMNEDLCMCECKYVCIYPSIHTCMYACTHISQIDNENVSLYLYMQIFYVRMHVTCIHLCRYESMYVCLPKCKNVCTFMHMWKLCTMFSYVNTKVCMYENHEGIQIDEECNALYAYR